jgi:hypothetical protein
MNNQAKNPLMYAEDSQKTKFWKWLDQNNNRTENHDDFFKEMIKKITIVTYSCFAQLDFTPSNHEVEIRASLVLALSHLHEREKINSAELLELLKLLEIDTSTTTSFNNHESVKKNIDSDEIINKWSRQAAAYPNSNRFVALPTGGNFIHNEFESEPHARNYIRCAFLCPYGCAYSSRRPNPKNKDSYLHLTCRCFEKGAKSVHPETCQTSFHVKKNANGKYEIHMLKTDLSSHGYRSWSDLIERKSPIPNPIQVEESHVAKKKERQRSCPNSKAKFPKRNDHKPKNRANFPSKKTDNSKELANDKGNATPESDLSDECNGSSNHSITSNDHDHVPPKKTVIVTTLTEKKKEVSLSSTTPAVSLSSTKRDGQNGQIDNEHSDGKEKKSHVTDKKSRMKKRETEISTEINLENKNNKQPPTSPRTKITQGVMDESPNLDEHEGNKNPALDGRDENDGKTLSDGPTMQSGQKEKKANGDSVRKDTSSKEREITMPLSSSTGIIPNTSNEDLPNMHKKTMIMLCGMSNFHIQEFDTNTLSTNEKTIWVKNLRNSK